MAPDSGMPAERQVLDQLQWLRAEVGGVAGSIVATTDGLLITHDIPGQDPVQLAALIATMLGLARQAAAMTGSGTLREAVVRGSDGYLAVFAAGTSAVLAVLGSNELHIGLLQFQAREAARLIGPLVAHVRGFAAVSPPGRRDRGPAGRRDDGDPAEPSARRQDWVLPQRIP